MEYAIQIVTGCTDLEQKARDKDKKLFITENNRQIEFNFI